MKTRLSLLTLVLTLAALAGCSRFGGAESPTGPSTVTPKVFMDPSTVTKPLNEEFTVSVYMENVTNLYYANIYIKYDPAKLDYVESAEGNFLNKEGATTIFAPYVFDPINGILNIPITRQEPKVGASGTGSLCTITFKAKGATVDTGTNIQFLNQDPYNLGFRGIDESLNEYDVEATVGNGTIVYIQ